METCPARCDPQADGVDTDLRADAIHCSLKQPQSQHTCLTFQGRVRRPGADDGFSVYLYISFAD